LTPASAHNAYMQFRLFNAVNNETIQHVTYKIIVTRGIASSLPEKPLLLNSFHSHIGLLTLHIEPTNAPITISGEHGRGLLHFHVEIFTMDNDTTLLTPQQAPKFDASLSLGDVFQSNWKYQNQNYNTTVVSFDYTLVNAI
jgi:hypothetical protein